MKGKGVCGRERGQGGGRAAAQVAPARAGAGEEVVLGQRAEGGLGWKGGEGEGERGFFHAARSPRDERRAPRTAALTTATVGWVGCMAMTPTSRSATRRPVSTCVCGWRERERGVSESERK